MVLKQIQLFGCPELSTRVAVVLVMRTIRSSRAPLAPLAALGLSALLLCGVTSAGCGGDPDSLGADPSDYVEIEDDGGKADGTTATFNRNLVLTDSYFTDKGFVDAAVVQQMLEKTPYENRSWLADYQIDGRPVSEVIVKVATAHGLNPLVLLARTQQEKGLVSKTVQPSSKYVDWAFGCGCYDGQACFASYRGFDKQLACAADVLEVKYADSEQGEGLWNKDKSRKTVDNIIVTPQSHATAAVYAYTPLVHQGVGGSWLTWNINRRYERYVATLRQQ